MSDLEFNEDKHEYRVAGTLLPSVTTILHNLSIMSRLDPALLKDAAERGRLVHRAVHLDNLDDLVEGSVDESVYGYLRAWRRFKSDHQFEWMWGETPLHSERWGFAGTPDCFGTWKQVRRRPHVLLDVKSGIPDPVHGPQTAAYLELARENDMLDRRLTSERAVVYLEATGFYKVERVLDQGDWSNFVAALTCYRFRERHGLL